MEICAANSSLETAIEVLAFSVDSATFELNQHSINEDSNELEETEINPSNLRLVYLFCSLSFLTFYQRIHPLAIPPEDEKYSYEETRTIKICPVNTARMEILRFNTAVDSFNLPSKHQLIHKSLITITSLAESRLHIESKELFNRLFDAF